MEQKRKPGRPRTRPIVESEVKRPPGRPSKIIDPVRKENNCRRGATHPNSKDWDFYENGVLIGHYPSLGELAFAHRRGYMWAYHISRKCRINPNWTTREGYQIFETRA